MIHLKPVEFHGGILVIWDETKNAPQGNESAGQTELLYQHHRQPRRFFQISETGGESFAPWFDISTKNRIRRKKLSNQVLQSDARPYLSGNQQITRTEK